MKYLHLLNVWSYTITLLLYLTFYFGLIAQFVLGIIQLIIFIYLLFNIKKFSKKLKNKLFMYLAMVLAYAAAAYFMASFKTFNDLYILVWTLAPMLIATYFVYITYQIKKTGS